MESLFYETQIFPRKVWMQMELAIRNAHDFELSADDRVLARILEETAKFRQRVARAHGWRALLKHCLGRNQEKIFIFASRFDSLGSKFSAWINRLCFPIDVIYVEYGPRYESSFFRSSSEVTKAKEEFYKQNVLAINMAEHNLKHELSTNLDRIIPSVLRKIIFGYANICSLYYDESEMLS
jgi:hypothetical protein